MYMYVCKIGMRISVRFIAAHLAVYNNFIVGHVEQGGWVGVNNPS